MLVFGSRAHGEKKRRKVPALGVVFHKAEWMESGEDPRLSPTISLIEQPAGFTLAPHFHGQNQFQLFIGGGGTIGASQLRPITVHYAGAFTGYGPLVAGPEGIQYFTIRPVCESGAYSITEDRDKLVKGPKRHATSQPVQPASTDELSALSECETQELIPAAADGLCARALRIPAGQALPCEFPPAADGVFLVVLAGSLSHQAGSLSQWESIFASTPSEFPKLSAGAGGAQAVLLFVPEKAAAYK